MSITAKVGTALLFGAEGLRQLYSGDGSLEVEADPRFFYDDAVVRRAPLQRFRRAALAVLTAVRLFRAIRRRRAAITQLLSRATNGITAQIRHFPAVPLLKRAEGASEAPSLASFTATPALDALVRGALRGRLQHSGVCVCARKIFLGIIPPSLTHPTSLTQRSARARSRGRFFSGSFPPTSHPRIGRLRWARAAHNIARSSKSTPPPSKRPRRSTRGARRERVTVIARRATLAIRSGSPTS